MEFIVMFFGTSIAGFVLYLVIARLNNIPGNNLQRKFVSMGDMRGKHRDEIVGVVGHPQSISAIDESSTLLQWMASGYDIGLIFENDICQGISHETNVSGGVAIAPPVPTKQVPEPPTEPPPQPRDWCEQCGAKMVGTIEMGRSVFRCPQCDNEIMDL